ncbi:hypothetical protein HDV06_004128 [Boothiomyces sp. JEL0866]|nr:hypothetical protein HDV06_004128 [Boothiomyces sp. JEL0866]
MVMLLDDNEKAEASIGKFLTELENGPMVVSTGIVSIEEKRQIVISLLQALDKNGDYLNWKDDVLAKALTCLRILSRETEGSEGLYTERAASIFSFHGGLAGNFDCTKNHCIEALKCLSNIQSASVPVRNIVTSSPFVSTYLPTLKLPGLNIGAVFLLTRLIFFATAVDPNLRQLFINDGALDVLAEHLSSVVKSPEPDSWVDPSVVINEILKVSFNLTVNQSGICGLFGKIVQVEEEDDSDSEKYKKLLSEIVDISISTPLGDPPMSAPHLHAINALMNFPVKPLKSAWLPDQSFSMIELLVNILHSSVKELSPDNNPDYCEDTAFGAPSDQAIIPLLILLKKLAGIEEVKQYLLGKIMPKNLDRTKSLTKGTGLPNCLIRCLTAVHLLNTRDFICELMITLCDNDSDQFVAYVGYGNAAGFLYNKGIPSKFSKSNLSEEEHDSNIDPITGTIKQDKPSPWEGMTDEEKERESERLFVLFDRLNKTGVIKVETKRE